MNENALVSSGGLLAPKWVTLPRTKTIVVRSRWWKRPWRVLRGRQTRWVVQWNEPPFLPIRNPLKDALPAFSASRGVR